jgi:G:T-mismatch repair DNA endonuclease (very short patch repair protein)
MKKHYNVKENHPNYKGGRPHCKDCGKEIWWESIRCRSCARKYQYTTRPETNPFFGLKKELNPNYKGGWKHFCIDCGIKIDFNSIRCRHHARIEQYKNPENHPMNNKHHTKSSLKKISKTMKKLWNKSGNRDRFIKAQRRGMQIYPNKPEKILIKLLTKISKDYKYTGNGSLIIDGFNPDFVNINGQKKIIEFYGTYWHKRPEVISRDIRRIKSYHKYGYKILIIWEQELKNINKLLRKLERFI